MSTQMKTPGVYIKERNAFPNSAVEAATAIPAFIGHTEKAGLNNEFSNKPIRIQSFNEFREIFGGPPQYKFLLKIQDDNKTDVSNETNYHFYNQINLYFTNGGGVCYIVSVGDYKKEIKKESFIDALVNLEYEDEPTLILAPEAGFLKDETELLSINQAILSHCEKMKFRFGILDTPKSKTNKIDRKLIDGFREGIGNKSLSFGAVYFPWLKTNIVSGNLLSYKNIFINNKNTNLIDHIINHNIKENDKSVSKEIMDIISSYRDIQNLINKLEETKTISKSTNINDFESNASLKESVNNILKSEKIAVEADKSAKSALSSASVVLEDYKIKLKAAEKAAEEAKVKSAEAQESLIKEKKAAEEATKLLNKTPENEVLQKAVEDANSNLENLEKIATELINKCNEVDNFLKIALSEFEQAEKNVKSVEQKAIHEIYLKYIKLELDSKVDDNSIHKTLINHLPFYKNVFTLLQEELNTLPPSTAIAGLYAYVDTNMGVWKSPANVSLNGVVSPTVILNHEDQADLNMPTNGKSINAIRSFKNDGIKVWGARTLDGNSQDWRYINVKRTMLMIQSTLKKSCNAYIFEPNDANTWVSLKSVINNYLHSVWKRGGLAGSTPEDAFSVSIGLGETMTPSDILDGILRIEILVAMVRPAEFIEITFQQKMQES